MRLNCDVIKDLLPLYVEGLASSDSCVLVEEHINYCNKCKNELEKLSSSNNIPTDTNIIPLKKIQMTLRKKKYFTIIFSVMLTLTIAAILIAYLSAPKYIPYSEETVTIIEEDNGMVLAKFGNEVSGYDVNKYYSEDNSGYIYHITGWDSTWSRHIIKNNTPNIVLNPDGENVVSVYYYLTNGMKDILILGENQTPDGGIVTLPRLFLTYYTVIAVIFALICVLFILIFRKNKKASNILTNILLLPIAYILSSVCVNGFTTVSYSATRDFFAILLVMIPLYCAMLIARKILLNRKIVSN